MAEIALDEEIDLEIAWDTIAIRIPELKENLEKIMKEMEGEGEDEV